MKKFTFIEILSWAFIKSFSILNESFFDILTVSFENTLSFIILEIILNLSLCVYLH